MILTGFAGAMRRSELVALQVADIQFMDKGMRVTIRNSKTDQEGFGQVIPIYKGSNLRVMETLQLWLQRANITQGPIFRPFTKSGRLRNQALSDRSVALILKHYVTAEGLDPADYAGHSLRSGFLTSAAQRGASIFKMLEVSRHKKVDTLRSYVRMAEEFDDHAGKDFL
jgi:site-specific recombinase XerD